MTEQSISDNNDAMKNSVFIRRGIFILSLVLLLIIIGGTYYFYNKYQQTQNTSSPQSQNTQAQQLTDIIGKFMELPTNEKPVIATVTDVTKLKKQAFFAHAKNGDKVLVYTKNRKAILYDPSEQKVVEVGPIFITTANNNAGTTIDTQAKISIYNSTTTPDLATTVSQEIKEQFPSVTIIKTGNVSKTSNSKTLVVNVTNKYSSLASQIATKINGTVGPLPPGEITLQDEDILIILGK